jgi:hypothetical protein
MTYFDELLDHLLGQVQVAKTTITEAKARRTAVLNAVASFDGVLRTYRSGSLAYGTAVTPPPNKSNDKGVDGDAGVVLNRKVWTTLGPDSDQADGPSDIVRQVQDHVRPILRQAYGDDLTVGSTVKRAILVKVNAPLATGEDPPVELVVALNRKAGALWIPNLDTNGWDSADPVTHGRLINDDPTEALRLRRARIVRLVKHWNKKHTQEAFSSFHLQALALEVIDETDVGCQLRTTLQRFFEKAAASLADGMTEDPAGVSGKFHLENDISRDLAVTRLENAATAIATANGTADDEAAVREELKKVFHRETVEAAEDSRESQALSTGNRSAAYGAAGTVGVRIRNDRPAAAKNPAAWAREG